MQTFIQKGNWKTIVPPVIGYKKQKSFFFTTKDKEKCF